MGTKFRPNKKDECGYSNGARAKSAEEVIRVHAALEPRARIEDYHIADLLVDLRHLCHRDNQDFEDLLDTSIMHFDAER